MPGLLFLAFLLMPLLELWVILQVGGAIGGWWTVLLLLADSVAGAVIVRREGRRAWSAFREALGAGRWPADEVAQGALVLVGGALLLTPGFVTDVMGLAFVLPPTRALLARGIRRRVKQGAIQVIGFGGPGAGPSGGPSDGASGPSGPSGRPRVGDRPGTSRGDDGGEVYDVEVVSVQRDDEDDDAGR